MKKYKCKECGAEFEGDYWNDTLRGQVGIEDFVPIEEAEPKTQVDWRCPACDKDVKVEEV